MWLFKRLVDEPELNRRFIRPERHDDDERHHSSSDDNDSDSNGDGESDSDSDKDNDNDNKETDGEATIEWNTTAVEQYLRKVRHFKETLFALVHLTAGAPARGTETISIQHRNSVDAPRGVFVDDGLVSFVTSYHKGYSQSRATKVVHRYVPAEVSKIWVYYLWMVQPFVEILQAMVFQQRSFGPFIWEPEHEDAFQEAEDQEADLVAAYSPFEQEDDDDDDENHNENKNENDNNEDEVRHEANIHAAKGQAGDEGENGEKAKNSDGFWGTARVCRVLQRETGARMGVRISTSQWRKLNPAIQRVHCDEEKVVQTIEDVYHGIEAPTPDETRAKHSGHSQAIENMMCGRLWMESPFHTVEEREKFKRVSQHWHRFLQFPSALHHKHAHPTSRARMEAIRVDEEFRRWQRIRKADLTVPLRQIVGDKAEFRGCQEAGLQAIVQGKSPILIVMGTGSGKSLFFMIPAAVTSDGITVVVIPLNSLRDDLQRRCEAAGIRCVAWEHGGVDFAARIVLVTPESAVSESFQSYLNVKRCMRQLERIVIDECHVVLDSDPDGTGKGVWRPDMLRLHELLGKGVQMVYLTATLPPSEEARFYNTVGIREDELTAVRTATTRKNVHYQVLEYAVGTLDDDIKRLVEDKKQKYARPGQIILSYETVSTANRLGRVLECPVYHANVGNQEMKRRLLQQLTSGQGRVFTATNALGLGIDAPGIRVVIHVGIRRSLRDYAQESGRAGRDGEKSEAIIVRTMWRDAQGHQKVDPGRQVQQEMREFVSGDRCRRKVMDGYMDGRSDRQGCEVDEERCDVCRGKSRGSRKRRIVVGKRDGVDAQEVFSGAEDGRIDVSIKRNKVEDDEDILPVRAASSIGMMLDGETTASEEPPCTRSSRPRRIHSSTKPSNNASFTPSYRPSSTPIHPSINASITPSNKPLCTQIQPCANASFTSCNRPSCTPIYPSINASIKQSHEPSIRRNHPCTNTSVTTYKKPSSTQIQSCTNVSFTPSNRSSSTRIPPCASTFVTPSNRPLSTQIRSSTKSSATQSNRSSPTQSPPSTSTSATSATPPSMVSTQSSTQRSDAAFPRNVGSSFKQSKPSFRQIHTCTDTSGTQFDRALSTQYSRESTQCSRVSSPEPGGSSFEPSNEHPYTPSSASSFAQDRPGFESRAVTSPTGSPESSPESSPTSSAVSSPMSSPATRPEQSFQASREGQDQQEREEFEHQRRQRETVQRRVSEHHRSIGEKVGAIEDNMARWARGCVICRARSLERVDHAWENCREEKQVESFRQAMATFQTSGEFRFANSSG